MGAFKKILSSGIFLYIVFSTILLIGVYYFALVWEDKTKVSQQSLNHQRTIARAGVGNITTFFERFGNSVAGLAQLSSIEGGDSDAVSDLDVFADQWVKNHPIASVVLTDKKGVVKFNSNVLGARVVGASLIDSDYFAWAKNEGKKGEYFISQPFVSQIGDSEPQTVIVVASPVYRDGVFAGVVAPSVKLDPLIERFFGLMKVSNLTQLYLVEEDGDLLYSNITPEVDNTIFEVFSADQNAVDMIKSALGRDKGGQFFTQKNLVAYSPITLGAQNWLFIVSSPLQ